MAVCVLGSNLFGQDNPAAAAKEAGGTSGMVSGGMGVTWIDGQPYYLINLMPELAFGNWGVGLDLNLHISSKDQKIRKEDFDETYDYLRIIRYIRYGHKGDELYARIGSLDYARLGHGSILYNYKNSPSIDNRRIGAALDIDYDKWGFESVYGDIAAAGVIGARGYIRPLRFTAGKMIPVINSLELGATFASDVRGDAGDTTFNWGTPYVGSGPVFLGKQNSGSLSIIGFDLGLPLLRFPWINMTAYYDYSKILNYGSGMAVGLLTDFSAMGLVNIYTKFERRFAQTDQYIPSYFDAFYELDRYSLALDTNNVVTGFNSKALRLAHIKSPGPGYFGSLVVDVLGTIQAEGSYERLDLDPNSGILHLGMNTGDKIPVISLSAGYDKKYITSNKDVFTLDNRSILYAEVGYKPYPFMIVSTVYTWTFAPQKDAGGNVIGYAPQKRITPKVSFVFPL